MEGAKDRSWKRSPEELPDNLPGSVRCVRTGVRRRPTERAQAMDMVEFAALIENRGWRWSMEIDGFTPDK